MPAFTKRMIASVLAFILVLSMTACGEKQITVVSPTTIPTGSESMPTEPSVKEPAATEPSVTKPPVTEPPVTEPPVTEPPATEPPVTEPPVTESPATEPPATEPPATEPPATEPHIHSWTTATCTTPKTCRTCGAVSGIALGHTVQTIPGQVPTKTTAGLTSGEKCTICHEVIASQVVIPAYAALYSDDFYYSQLMNYTNGSAMQALYRRIDEAAMRFHFDTSLDAADGIALRISFADLGITTDDAKAVLMHYHKDHPLYYWIQSYITSTLPEAGFGTDPEYASGTDRAKLNKTVIAAVSKYMNMISGERSAYQIALTFHDAVILNTDYVYDPVTGSPEDDAWAHNIIGFIDGRGVVCEGYARMYQLLLNAAGIENILASGNAGHNGNVAAHAWNLLQLEDGGWYWCDLTWDDQPSTYLGVAYRYFCTNDTQNTNWYDGGWSSDHETFLQSHFPNIFSDGRPDMKLHLPARSTAVFSGNTPKLRDSFTVDGLTYSINGVNTVQLIHIGKSGPIVIPETVSYTGRSYVVNAVGSADENGCYNATSVIPVESGITTIHIPKTVAFIWANAFRYGATGFTVAADNPHFTSKDGCLYTKSLYTLIDYPHNLPTVERFVIPDETVLVSETAFASTDTLFNELVIGKNVANFGFANWGSGYPDSKEEDRGGNLVTSTLAWLRKSMSYAPGEPVTFVVDAENIRYKVIDGILYSMQGEKPIEAIVAATSDITHAVIVEGVSEIGAYAFQGCQLLQSVTIPTSVRELYFPFANCRNIHQVYYQGTIDQWNNLRKGTSFNQPQSDIQVICTDGTLEYPMYNSL